MQMKMVIQKASIVMIATQLYDQALRRFAVTALIKIVQVPTGRRKRATSMVMASLP